MNVSLSKGLEDFIKSKVATGKYNSTSEVVREALRLLMEQDQKKQALLDALQVGFDDLDAGRYTTKSVSEIFDEAMAKRVQEK